MKKMIAAALMAAMVASLASCGKSAKAEDTEFIYGKIDSISGNDVVLLLADYNEDAEESGDRDSSGSETSGDEVSREKSGRLGGGEKSKNFTRPENGEMPDGFDPGNFSGSMPEGFDPSNFSGEMPEGFTKPENGEMPEGFDPSNFSGSMPEGFDPSNFSGEIPEGFTKPENGEMPDGFDPGNFSGSMPEGFDPSNFSGEIPEGFTKPENGEMPKRSNRESTGSSAYTLTGEQTELRIPVGTTVTTSLGVKTDFDALSSGDIIKCSVEKNSSGEYVVTEVWIMEQ